MFLFGFFFLEPIQVARDILFLFAGHHRRLPFRSERFQGLAQVRRQRLAADLPLAEDFPNRIVAQALARNSVLVGRQHHRPQLQQVRFQEVQALGRAGLVVRLQRVRLDDLISKRTASYPALDKQVIELFTKQGKSLLFASVGTRNARTFVEEAVGSPGLGDWIDLDRICFGIWVFSQSHWPISEVRITLAVIELTDRVGPVAFQMNADHLNQISDAISPVAVRKGNDDGHTLFVKVELI